MLKGKKIGFVFTGSFYNYKIVIPKVKELIKMGARILPIMSFNSYKINTKFSKAKDTIMEIENITSNKIIHTIEEAEPIGIKHLTDIMIIAPCSGNTLAKLANGISDTPTTVAVKSHLRNEKNVLIAMATNDALSTNAVNIGQLLNKKHFYFVPFRQDNPITKPYSMSFDVEYIIPSIEKALVSEQIQPIIL